MPEQLAQIRLPRELIKRIDKIRYSEGAITGSVVSREVAVAVFLHTVFSQFTDEQLTDLLGDAKKNAAQQIEQENKKKSSKKKSKRKE